jgi:hypothetical protein
MVNVQQKEQEQSNQKRNVYAEIEDNGNDWLVYSNNKYGFSFKHPKSCEVETRYDSGGDDFGISCPMYDGDIYNFIIFTPQNSTISFEEYLSKERGKCSQWLQEFIPSDKNASDDIITGEINKLDAILNISSCGHNMGSPSEFWLFSEDKKIVVNFVGDIYINKSNFTKLILESFEYN